MIVCSLNEVEVYGRRAARGAGMPWGLAEEAGKAARWVAERGLPGVELLACLLEVNDGRPYEEMAPVIANGRWQAPAGELCPVCTGAALSDRIDVPRAGSDVRLLRLACPLLLAPFLDQASRPRDVCYELRWPNARVRVSRKGLAIECAEESAHAREHVHEVRLSVGAHRDEHSTRRAAISGVRVSREVWRRIDALARRTYVPASEESRARGAGAARNDND